MSDQNRIPLVFVKFRGKDKTSISQRSDYGNNCILFAYEQIKNRIESENICLSDTSIRPRNDIYLFDMNCVNEALINAIVHNDWSITEPLVSVFSDRIEILSHGGLPHNQTKEQFYKGISKPRNEKLMRIFSDMGISEHTGHGIPTIIASYGEEVFEIGDNYINVVIPFEKKALKILKEDISINIKSNFITTGDSVYRMSETEKKIVELIEANEYITANEISEKLNISKRTVERAFANLQSNNIIARFGSKKTGYWFIV